MRLMPCGMLFQSYSHSCLRDINDIVSEFLALCDDVHIYGSDAIRVFLFVYVCYVLVLELVTEIIDFCLYVDDLIYVTCLPMPDRDIMWQILLYCSSVKFSFDCCLRFIVRAIL